MAKVEPINIQIDPEHLRAQIKDIIDQELRVFAGKLRWASDALDPEFAEHQDQWVQDQIAKGIAKTLNTEVGNE